MFCPVIKESCNENCVMLEDIYLTDTDGWTDTHSRCILVPLVAAFTVKLTGTKPTEPLYEDCSDARCFKECFLCMIPDKGAC